MSWLSIWCSIDACSRNWSRIISLASSLTSSSAYVRKGIPIRKWRDTFGRGFNNFWVYISKFGTEVNFCKKINSLLCQHWNFGEIRGENLKKTLSALNIFIEQINLIFVHQMPTTNSESTNSIFPRNCFCLLGLLTISK